MQQPSIGRIVLYCFCDRSLQIIERPAIITSVEKTTISAHVFFEEMDTDRMTRAEYACEQPRYVCIPYNASDEPLSNMWRWPPRV